MKIFILTMLFVSATLSLCNENKTFYERIDVFQSDIKELCSHIENESLDKAKKFLDKKSNLWADQIIFRRYH